MLKTKFMVKLEDKGYRIEQDATVLEKEGFRYLDPLNGTIDSGITARQVESMYVRPGKFEEVAIVPSSPQGRSRGMDMVLVYVKD